MSDLSLAVGCCFYQDAAGLRRLCKSLEEIPFISNIYAVDGRFVAPMFGTNEDPELSTDLDILEENSRLKIISLANVSEWQKRQGYIEECYRDKPDFLFILDTDEYVKLDNNNNETDFENHLKEIKQQMLDNPNFIYHNVYNVRFDDRTQGIHNLKPRLWFRPYQMEHTKHKEILYGAFRNKQYTHYHTDPAGSMYAIEIIRGITMIHDKTLRTEEYEIKNRDYHIKQLAGAPTVAIP